MTSTEAMGQSPLISVWLKPRRTIETVLNRESGRGLWLLASLNAMSNFAMALAASGFAKLLMDWRILLGAAAASVAGIAGLYISSFIFAGIGRMLRGRASPFQLRRCSHGARSRPFLAFLSL